ncbi:MAG: ribonuclease E inhibitor RraB [Verrucomicrobiales bacterium]|nr:ribonuclease E inhibitor RraB [Verrucomicrobiales bacterium]
MPHDFPNDADGDALRRFVEGGSDLSKPMTIDFQVAVPDEAAANGLAEVVYKLGYRVKICASPECSLPWTCECSTRMLARYDGVIAMRGTPTSEASYGLHGR